MSIVCVGPFPPPVHGMAKNLKLVADELEKNNTVYRISTSPGSLIRGWRYHLSKAFKILLGSIRLLQLFCFKDVKSLYLPPDAGFGAYYSLVFITFARLFSKKIYLHHRSFAYINRKTLGMSLIVKVSGNSATHVFLCPQMKTQFENVYRNIRKSRVVSNASHVKPLTNTTITQKTGGFTLGFLSNLSKEKGLWDVIDLAINLKSKAICSKLIIGGPFDNDESADYLRSIIQEHGLLIEYRGFLDVKAKDVFFREIDIFLFPTSYRNEAQPNVLFEANAYGIPVISYERGCISSDLDNNNGFVIKNSHKFSEEGTAIIEKWFNDLDSFYSLRQSTLRKIIVARELSIKQYQDMIDAISAGAD